MATLEQLSTALRNADAAGDVQAATALAQAIKAARGQEPVPPLAQFRQQYPQYNDMSDQQLGDALHRRFYSDLPRADFDQKVGLGVDKSAGQQKFLITAPDGRKFRVTGDNAEGALAAVRKMIEQNPPPVSRTAGMPQKVKQGATTDLMASLGAGGRGALDTVSFGADDEIGAGLRTGFGFLGDYGKDVTVSRALKAKAQEEHPWAYGAGQVAGVLPTLAIPGMGIAKGATLAGKMVRGAAASGLQGAAYGFGSGEGDVAERLPGAATGTWVGAGLGASVPLIGTAIGKAIGRKIGAAAVPSVEARKVASQDLYKQAKQIGVTVRPESFSKAVNDIVAAINKEGIDPGIQPKAFAAAQRLVKAQASGAAPNLQDLDILRQVSSNIARDGLAGENERRMAGLIVGKIDDFMDNLQPSDIISGNAGMAVPILKEARKLWRIKSKGDLVERAIADAQNAKGGVANGLENEFRKLLKSGRYKWTPDEMVALQKVVRDGSAKTILKTLGVFGYNPQQAKNVLGLMFGGRGRLGDRRRGRRGATGARDGGQDRGQSSDCQKRRSGGGDCPRWWLSSLQSGGLHQGWAADCGGSRSLRPRGRHAHAVGRLSPLTFPKQSTRNRMPRCPRRRS